MKYTTKKRLRMEAERERCRSLLIAFARVFGKLVEKTEEKTHK